MSLFLVPLGTVRKYRWLLEYGKVAPGRITAVSRGTSQTVSYEFLEPSGRLRKGRTYLQSFAKARRGGPITVLYDPAKPDRNAAYPFDGLLCIDGSATTRYRGYIP